MSELKPFRDDLDGLTFVEASAGTGKTYAIEMLYLRLLVERQLTPEQIVVVTYTNAAAAELRDRIRKRLQAAWASLAAGTPAAGAVEEWARYLRRAGDGGAVRRRLLTALYGFDRASISTIHSFCQRVLQEHAFDSGAAFEVEMIADQTAVVDEVVRDFIAGELHEAPRFVLEQLWGHATFANLVSFTRIVVAQPDLAIVPRDDDAADLAAWSAVFAEARALWDERRREILALCAAEGLRKNAVPDAAALQAGLAGMFAVPEPYAGQRFAAVAKLRQSYLESKTKQKCAPPRHEFFARCEALVELEERMASAVKAGFYRRLADYARREVPRRKLEAGVVYFDDLLLRLRDALAAPGGSALADKLRGRFAAALIDEFQDTDPVQYEIFSRVFGSAERPLFLIGDPKQSIYKFRGADVMTYVAARSTASRISTLDTNRRSSERVVGAVNTLFRAPDSFATDAIRFEPVVATGSVAELQGEGAAGLTFLWCDAPAGGDKVDDFRRQVQRGVASRIVALLDSNWAIEDRRLRPRDVAVLCRKNAEAAAVQVELRRRGVPTVLAGDRSVFETVEAAELARVMGALVDPRDASAIRSALCTPLCGVSGDELAVLRQDERLWQPWVDRFRRWRTCWDEHGFMAAFRALRDECNTAGRLLAVRGGERQLTNYLHLAELLQVASRELRSGPQGLADWLALMCADVGARGELAAESAQVRLESDADAVVLTTVHRSKGLEYPIVFVPFAWSSSRPIDKGLVPFHEPVEGRSIWVGPGAPEAALAQAATEALAEEMRLAYVALTRAKHGMFVVVPDYGPAVKSPLGRLLESLDRDHLRGLAARSDGAIGVETLSASAGRLQRSIETAAIEEPPAAPRVSRDWRVSSFSGLAKGGESLTAQEEQGLDLDEVAPSLPAVDGESGAEITLAALESGTRVGLMIHSIFENLDFQVGDAAALRELVAAKTSAFRVAIERVEAICAMIGEVMGAPLPGPAGAVRLADVPRSRRLDELEFILPVSRTGGARLSAGRLADVLRAHGAPVADPSYAERVRGLGFGAFAGFLRGYIDMVFEHDGLWYVVDYKSNFLGRRRGDYARSRLLAPMRHHDYFLQYLLYVVATHRHLSRRLPGYSYDRHFGGVHYLFLRGMGVDDASAGIFSDRPTAALIGDLSQLFDEGAPVAGRARPGADEETRA